MRKGFSHTELIIDTKRYYPLQELFEMVKKRFGDQLGTITANKELKLVETVFIESPDGWVSITTGKWGMTGRGRIVVGLEKPFKKSLKPTVNDIIFIILCFVTVGIIFFIRIIIDFFRGIFNLEGTAKNRIIMKKVAEEVNNLVEK